MNLDVDFGSGFELGFEFDEFGFEFGCDLYFEFEFWDFVEACR